LRRNDEFTRTGIKTACYFFASALVSAHSVDLDLDFDFWANCWLYNPSKPNFPKFGLKKSACLRTRKPWRTADIPTVQKLRLKDS